MLITIAETAYFQRKAQGLLSENEREELFTQLANEPASGVVIREAGGIRKLRWGRAGIGKSSGVRVIYYFHDDTMPLYLLAIFGKNEKANLSKQERNDLAKAVKELVAFWRVRNGQSVH
ncbi:MAG: type II toxin-antitoxin system RelE/ParE family toxin [Gammaproteobacteria bacterium]|nr:type II toxin-antitoxin system RelE/ParE family toxin [Gammaproteobacteria bacterium]